MTTGIIGTGMMGGSFAWLLKRQHPGMKILGYDAQPEHAEIGVKEGFLDAASGMNELVNESDIILITIPVNEISGMIGGILDQINAKQVVMDIGSTKTEIMEVVRDHPN